MLFDYSVGNDGLKKNKYYWASNFQVRCNFLDGKTILPQVVCLSHF